MKRDRQRLQQDELGYWRAWKSNPTPQTLEPLLTSLQPIINAKVNEFSAAPVPPAAVEGFAKAQAVKALQGFDPNRGASVGTYVSWHLQKTRAFVTKYQNMGRIPEHRTYNITAFKTAQGELRERLGREPDTLTLAEHLGWSTAEVGRMQAELRSDLIASKSPEPDQLVSLESAREREVLRYIHQDLTPDERLVLEYSLGLYGRPKISATEIARTMNISLPKVSRLRAKIDKRLRERGI